MVIPACNGPGTRWMGVNAFHLRPACDHSPDFAAAATTHRFFDIVANVHKVSTPSAKTKAY